MPISRDIGADIQRGIYLSLFVLAPHPCAMASPRFSMSGALRGMPSTPLEIPTWLRPTPCLASEGGRSQGFLHLQRMPRRPATREQP